jgi:hypothetical protein
MNYFIYYCFLIFIVLIFSYINSTNTIENFTPKIRELYRPIVRNTRIITENFYNRQKTNISNIFRKFGII